jgi:alkaline phosphatase D
VTPTDRREFLKAAGLATTGLAGLGAIPVDLIPEPGPEDAARFDATAPGRADEVFPQSLASGDPTPEGVILWTRVAPEADDGEPLALEVARDAGFEDTVHKRLVPPDRFGPDTGHTVRVDLDGSLLPDRTYHYRFLLDGVPTRTGRCRTLPRPDASPEGVRLALVTCQDFMNGHYPALEHVAREDVDFVVHVGDFIYEYNGEASWNGKRFEGRGMDLPSGAPRMESLEDLYYVWQRYRSDPQLQAMLEAHTILPTWDDHEITNDRYYDHQEGRHYGDDSFHLNDDPERLDAFFQAGLKAYIEWMPIRAEHRPAAEDPLDRWRMYRSFRFGDLLELFLLDERWYRSPPPEGEREQTDATDDERDAGDRTMLGEDQRAWLTDGLRATDATWTALGNPVQLSPAGIVVPGTSVYVNLDAWDGYEADRRAVVDAMAEADNALALTGDLHSYMVGYVERDPNAAVDEVGERVGVELMTPGVTSGNLIERLEAEGYERQPGDDEVLEAGVLAANPHMEHFNSSRHGYAIVDVTPERTRYEGYVVDKATPRTEGNRELLSVFEVPEGEVEAREVERRSPTGTPLEAVPSTLAEADPRKLRADRWVIEDLDDLRAAVRETGGIRPAGLRPRRSALPSVDEPGPG